MRFFDMFSPFRKQKSPHPIRDEDLKDSRGATQVR
jgi:hypothetical protein